MLHIVPFILFIHYQVLFKLGFNYIYLTNSCELRALTNLLLRTTKSLL